MTERQKEQQVIDSERQQTGLSTADMAAAGRQATAPGAGTKEIIEDAVPVESTPAAPSMPTTQGQAKAQPTPLLVADETHTFRSRWDSIQTGFVDEPRHALQRYRSFFDRLLSM